MMEIEKLIERLDDWEGCDAIYKGKFVEANCCIASRLLEEAAAALEQLQAENDRLKRERDSAVEDIPHECKTCVYHEVVRTTMTDGNGAVQRRNEHGTV